MDDAAVASLRRAVTTIARTLNQTATAEGLTPTQASVLSLVATRGPLAVSELITLEQLNPSTVSRVIGKLDHAGLVRRAPGTHDQRTATITITNTGQHTHQRIKHHRSRLVANSIAHLPIDQATTLTHAIPALEKLAELLNG